MLREGLRSARRGLAWWSLGLVGLVALMVSVYPSIRDNPDMKRLVEEYPDALKAFMAFGGEVEYGTAAGYLGSELYAFMVPILLLVAAIGAAARSIAGEEERGTLDLLLANPVSRRRVALEKLATVAVNVVALGAVLWAALAVGTTAASMDVGLGRLAAATTAAVLLALVFAAVAFLLGAATGKRGKAVAVASALAVLTYVLNALSSLVDFLEPARWVSPFFHYAAGDPLRNGLSLWHALVLAGIALVAAALALPAFERRDLTSAA
ncbi:MAG TPA: ABC transporter permease subunit [Gaiellaceae bacterium]